jgi:hypothetical protein
MAAIVQHRPFLIAEYKSPNRTCSRQSEGITRLTLEVNHHNCFSSNLPEERGQPKETAVGTGRCCPTTGATCTDTFQVRRRSRLTTHFCLTQLVQLQRYLPTSGLRIRHNRRTDSNPHSSEHLYTAVSIVPHPHRPIPGWAHHTEHADCTRTQWFG